MSRTPPPRKVAHDDDPANEGTRVKKCGCRIDVETGVVLDFCEKHEEADEDGYDDEEDLLDSEEFGR
jgi:hypothetical protein